MTLELGFRMDRDDVVEKVNWSPRAGVSIGVLPDGRGILRGGVGKFLQRTPLNVGAFGQFESRTVTRFAADGTMIGAPLLLRHVSERALKTPEATVGNIEWDQRFGRRVIVKASYLRRSGSHEYILNPEPANGVIRLSSTGASRYWEFETTARYLGSGRKDITISYVRSHGTADLNNYDTFCGNLRTPFIRPNENSLIPHDVPHRLLIRGLIGVGSKWDVAPVLELRSGFPWSAVDEFQDFVGARNRAGRLPFVKTFDVAVTRPVPLQEIHLPRRHPRLQPVRRLRRSRRPAQHYLPQLRPLLQSHRTLHRHRHRLLAIALRADARLRTHVTALGTIGSPNLGSA